MTRRAVRRWVDAKKNEPARRFIEKSAGNMKALLVDPLGNLAPLQELPTLDRPHLRPRCNSPRPSFPKASARDGGQPEAGRVPAVVEDQLLRPYRPLLGRDSPPRVRVAVEVR